MTKSWYDKGLRFGCTQCGNCCRNHGAYSYVYLASSDVAAITGLLELAKSDFLSRYCIEEDGWVSLRMDRPACPFLGDDNRCGIYSARPKQCQTWPFWKENLERATWEGAVKECCPGIGRGDLVAADEIDRRARETDEVFDEEDGTSMSRVSDE